MPFMLSEDPVNARPEFRDAFISYARVDRARITLLLEPLQAARVGVWVDEKEIGDAVPWRPEIGQALDRASSVLFFLSAAFVASAECRVELHEAIARRKRLIPVRLEPLNSAARASLPSELSEINDIDAERLSTETAPALAHRIAAAVQADSNWDARRRQLLTLARLWDESGRQPGRLLRLDQLRDAQAALALHEAGKRPGLSELEQLHIAVSTQAATVEAARQEQLRRASFARRASMVRTLIDQEPRTALALAAAVWRAADMHDTRRALAEALVAHRRLQTFLNPPAPGHTDRPTAIAFMSDAWLATVDPGGLWTDGYRAGVLCLWEVATATLRERDTRLGGYSVAATANDCLAIGARVDVGGDQRFGIAAAQFFNDADRFPFKWQWFRDAGLVEHLAYNHTSGLLAAGAHERLTIRRTEDGLERLVWNAPQSISALAWLGADRLAIAVGQFVHLLPSGGGDVVRLDIGAHIVALAALPDGRLAVARAGESQVLLFDAGGSLVGTLALADVEQVNALVVAPEGRLLVAGGGGNTSGPSLVLFDLGARSREEVYTDFRRGVRALAVSPRGRWVAGVPGASAGEPPGATAFPLWDLAPQLPLPSAQLDCDAAPRLACAISGSDGFATAHDTHLVLRDGRGVERVRVDAGGPVTALAGPTAAGQLAVANSAGTLLLVNRDGVVVKTSALVSSEAIETLVVTSAGTRLIAATSARRVFLVDAADLSVLAVACRHRASLFGTVTDVAPDEAPVASGAVAWPDHPWVLLDPCESKSLIGGRGWWDTRTDVVVWERGGTLAGNFAASVWLAGDRFAAREAFGVEVQEVRWDAKPDASHPEVSLYNRYEMIDPPMEIVPLHGGLLAARCYLELILIDPDEASLVARFPVPDNFRLVAATGDGRAIVAAHDTTLVSISVDPAEWSALAARKAGRDLSDAERRRYLPETIPAPGPLDAPIGPPADTEVPPLFGSLEA